MKVFFRSFYWKLSIIFLALLLILAVVQIWITIDSTRNFHAKTEQTLNARLAKDIIPDIAPVVKDSIDTDAIMHQMHFMMLVNPKIEIYLIDNSGKILAYFVEKGMKVVRERVDLQPIADFIREPEGEHIIVGDDPRNFGRRKPFSAAALDIAGEQGYLYVITESQLFDSAVMAMGNDYIVESVTRGVILSLLCTGIIGLILFAFLTRRMRRMTTVVRQFETGDYDKRVEVKREDEIGQLGNAFNNMADTIVANMEELRDVDALRRELIANVSHDLRSPLASIKGYLETILIKDSDLAPDEREKYINIILNTANMLEKLVNQLFELSKLDARQTQPNFEPFSITDLVQDVVMKFHPVAEKQRVNLTASMPKKLPQVFADIGMIERALSNLIENALRYTPEGGYVKVEITEVSGKIHVRVIDTGCGISENDLPHIFDRFYRVDKSRTRDTGGTGLGLAIAKRILDIHESLIDVSSELDVGTRFSFDLHTSPQNNIPALQPE